MARANSGFLTSGYRLIGRVDNRSCQGCGAAELIVGQNSPLDGTYRRANGRNNCNTLSSLITELT